MKPLRARLWLLAGAACLCASLPALGQQSPESLLPPGFSDPAPPAPPPEPKAAPATPAAPAAPRAAPATVPSAVPSAAAGEETVVSDISPEELALLEGLSMPKPIEIPDASRRETGEVGPFVEHGLGRDAFGNSSGRYLSTLLRRLDAPIASRWTAMLLRRALLTHAPAPRGVHPVDWVAERAWLLLRMGEADGARMLVQAVDVDQFTPKMFEIAVQTALANADPAALCPLVEPGRALSAEPIWPLAEAVCAALAGDSTRASQLIGEARRRSGLAPIDISLAEKLVGAGENARRAVSVQWDDVDTLSSWRFGMAAAAGIAIPERLRANTGRHVLAWEARAPMVPIEERLRAAHVAASLGVLSNPALIETYSLIADTMDPSDMRDSVPERLREAYVDASSEDRMKAIRALWEKPASADDRHARRILTAAAAARLKPSAEFAADADELIASMLAAGLDRKAARWAGVAQAMEEGAAADRAWALLATGTTSRAIDVSAGRLQAYAERDEAAGRHRARTLFAALAGLGRLGASAQQGLAEDLGVRIGVQNAWTRALDGAARDRRTGTVAVLAALGMQTADWSGVPPEHLYHILRSLRQVGLDYEARMIAAEAMARL